MRNAIREKLVESICELKGHVFEPFMAGPNTEKPYVVVTIGGEATTNMRYGFDLPVRIWPYVERTSFKEVDDLAKKIRDALLGKDLTTKCGLVFRLRYVGSGEDFYDPEWDALTRRLDFVTDVVRGG